MLKLTSRIGFVFVLHFACVNVSIGQHLKGKVIDKDNRVISYAKVVLTCKNDSAQLIYITNASGTYEFNLSVGKSYNISASYLSLHTPPKVISLQQDSVVNLLISDTMTLNEVVVISRKASFLYKSDRFVYTPNKEVKGASNTLEILSHTPLLDINAKGINLVGKSNAMIYINHHPSQMAGDILLNYLQTISGENIKRIEIVANPGPQYEASVTGGIVDIILKRELDEGWKYSLWQDSRNYHYSWLSGYFEADYHKNKFGISITPYYNNQIQWNQFSQNTKTRRDFIQNSSFEGRREPFNYGLQMSIDYYINSRETLNFTNTAYQTDITFPSANRSIYLHSGSNLLSPDSISLTRNNSDERTRNLFGSINYTKLIDTIGQSLTVNLNYNLFNNNQKTNGASSVFSSNQPTSLSTLIYSSVAPQNVYNGSFKLDYVKPIARRHLQVEAGVQYNATASNTKSSWQTTFSGSSNYPFLTSSNFSMNENIYSAFASIVFNRLWTDKIQLTLGARFERYKYFGKEYYSDNVVIRKNSLFPNVNLSFAPDQNHQLVFSSAGRIRRPDFGILSSAIMYENPNLYDVGNPFLQPIVSYEQQLTYVYKAVYYGVLDYTSSSNNYSQFFLPDNLKPNLFFSKQLNYGFSHVYSLSLGLNRSFLKGFWDLNATVQQQYSDYESFNTFTIQFKKSGFSSNISLDNTFHLSKKHKILGVVTMNYSTRSQLDNSLVYVPTSSIVVGLKKSWVHFIVSAYVYDPYRGMSQYVRFTPNSYQVQNDVKITSDSKGLGFSLKYNFGNTRLKKLSSITAGNEDYNQRIKK